MDNFDFLLFDGLDLKKHTTIKTNLDNLINDLEKALGREGGCSMSTSSWMNRFPVFENNGKSYILVPSTVPSYNDVVKATVSKYAVLLHEGDGFVSFTDEDIEFFIENLPKQFGDKERKQKEKETEQEYARLMIRDTFRMPLFICKDATADVLRFLIENNLSDMFIPLVTAAAMDGKEIVEYWCNVILSSEPRFKDIDMSVSELADDIIVFFTPEIQFSSLGYDLQKGLATYYSLCEEGHWLRESFLGISSKEVRDDFKEFLMNNFLEGIRGEEI